MHTVEHSRQSIMTKTPEKREKKSQKRQEKSDDVDGDGDANQQKQRHSKCEKPALGSNL